MRFGADRASVNQLYGDFNGPNGIEVFDPTAGKDITLSQAYANTQLQPGQPGYITMDEFCGDLDEVSIDSDTCGRTCKLYPG